MPTLENFQGSSLIPDLLGALQLGIKSHREVEDRRLAEESLQRDLDLFKQSERHVKTIAESDDPETRRAARVKLGLTNPKALNAIEESLKGGNERELAKAKLMAEQGTRRALWVLEGKTVAKRKNRWEIVMGAKIASREDIPDDLKIKQLGDDEFDLRMQLMADEGQAIKTLLGTPVTEQDRFKADEATKLQKLKGEQAIEQERLKPNKPMSPEGKTAFDIANGLITESEAASGDFEVSKLNPNDFTPESWKIATSSGGSSQDLRPSELALKKADRGEFATGGAFIIRNADNTNSIVIPVTNKRTGETKQNIVKLGGPLVEKAGGLTAQEKSNLAVETAGAKTRAERMAIIDTQTELTNTERAVKRDQDNIDSAFKVVDQVPLLTRTLELLELIETGGVDEAIIRGAQALGVESANVAELSFNLSKNVMKQLKPTFGAQFTEREGQMLIRIEAGIGKSTAGNIRLVKRALEVVGRAITRGQTAAARQGDEAALEDLQFLLRPVENLDSPQAQPRQSGKASKKFNPATGLLE